MIYNIEGVMTTAPGGWLLALDRPFEGGEGDALEVENSEPPVQLTVQGIVESENGVNRDIVIHPVENLHDYRYLVGRKLKGAGSRG